MLWQNPGGRIDWFSEVYPDADASYLWVGPETIEIRVWKHHKLWLDQHGKWHKVEEAQWCPPSKVISKEEALRMQIKELEPDVHILSYNMDRCAACKWPGQRIGITYPPCPGWIND